MLTNPEYILHQANKPFTLLFSQKISHPHFHLEQKADTVKPPVSTHCMPVFNRRRSFLQKIKNAGCKKEHLVVECKY